MIIVVFRLIDVVSILILCPNIISVLPLQVVRTSSDKDFHSLHLVDTGIDRPLPFLYWINLDATVVDFLNKSRVRAISNHFQIPRPQGFYDVAGK